MKLNISKEYKVYSEDEYLMLSGIQHFYYCKRQWSLIHIEQQWADNQYTIEGQLLHEKADNPYLKEKRKGRFFSRAMPVSSTRLGMNGILDVVEFNLSENSGVKIANRRGLWQPEIIEFKRGKPKKDLYDIVQLVAEVICLEEALKINIPVSYIYYAQTNKRLKVEITNEYRDLVYQLADEMHDLYNKQITIPPEECKCDRGSSLTDISMAHVLRNHQDINQYMFSNLDEDKL